MNNTYVMNDICGMYIMLCNSLIPILRLFKFTPEKHKMRQFSEQGDVMSNFPKGKTSRHARPNQRMKQSQCLKLIAIKPKAYSSVPWTG